MERPAKPFTVASMVNATCLSAMYVDETLKRVTALQNDSEQEQRLRAHFCKSCFYVLSAIGGAAMTTQPCACCGKDQLYGSTYTDALCLDCAKEHTLCKHCGGDLDMRERRRKWPEKKDSK